MIDVSMLGTVVGSYRIIDRIAVGGMGTVYRAEHQLIGRIAAVKILHPEMSNNREIVNRFFNEAKATTAIKHPGIVEIFDFGYMPSGHAYLVMEYLEGEPLSMRIQARGRFPEGEAAMLMRGVCSALAAAHSKGIVHRDLKPDNLFIVADPESPMGVRTKLLDFGIAKLTDVGLAGSATKTGAVMGTPTYMSPEQCKGTGDVDHRADLYSIGCMLYELVVGRPPFVEAGAGELLGSHLFVEPDPPSRYGTISRELEALIMTLLAKRPDQRVQSAFELAQQLVAIAASQGWVTTTGVDGRLSSPMMNGPTASRPLITPMFQTPATLPPVPTPLPHQKATEFMPSNLTPSRLTPPGRLTPPPPMQPMEPKPTTLSGAASSSEQHEVPRRKGMVIAIGLGLLAAAAGIAIVVGTSGGTGAKAEPTAANPSNPPEIAPAQPPVDPPKPEQPANTQPADTEPVAPPPVADVKPPVPDDKPDEPAKPEPAKPEPAKPDKTEKAEKSSRQSKTTKTPRQTKQTKTNTQAGKQTKTEKSGDLLETDID